MKLIAIGLLFMGGILAAQDAPAPDQSSKHLSESDRIAQRSQSPSVKTHGRKHADKPTKYTVTKNKTTIVATRAFNPDQK